MWRDVTPISMWRVHLTVTGEVYSKTFLHVFLSSSFYQNIQQLMKIQEIPTKSKVLGAPWIFLKFL